MEQVSDYIVALTNLYGVVHKDKVIEIYNMQNKEKLIKNLLDAFAEKFSTELEKQYVYTIEDYFVLQDILLYPMEFERHLRLKKDKPYYIPKKKELMKYKDEYYTDAQKEYRKMFTFIKNNYFKEIPEKAEQICSEIIISSKCNVRLEQVFKIINENGIFINNKRDFQKLSGVILNFIMNSRRCENNGFTQNEMIEYYHKQNKSPEETDMQLNEVFDYSTDFPLVSY